MSNHITAAGNTEIPAYLALLTKGYRVSWQRGESSPEDEIWFAEGQLGKFSANGPIELLGLVSMREIRGEKWEAPHDEIDRFMAAYDA